LNNPSNKNIVFFDGLCGLCNSFVDFLLRIDRNNKLLFATLQGKTAKEYLPESQISDLDTLVYLKGDRQLIKSTAVLQILSDLGGFWKVVIIFKLLPRFIRDAVYEFVAKNRLKWFGKRPSCRMPTEGELSRILP